MKKHRVIRSPLLISDGTNAAPLQQSVGTASIVYTYDAPPGHYDVIDTAAGQVVRRTFTVNVRTPSRSETDLQGPEGRG
ncbi:hypothetical protein [Streptomyces spongiae]|uniref:Uncharacterized protein n=1 Tax=Streptomyces spongiae TaxID=565072 RepID=A0A5N8XJ86_9ACTN|nr:hypothetical protein [Streptomyces spongiae]MPY59314.1 hypothetical protein [Streptomyces spongiae]